MRILTINVNRFRGEKAGTLKNSNEEKDEDLQKEKIRRINELVGVVIFKDADVVVFTEVDNTTMAVSKKSDYFWHYRDALILALAANKYASFCYRPWTKGEKNGAVLIAVKSNLNSKIIVENQEIKKKVINESQKTKKKVSESNLAVLIALKSNPNQNLITIVENQESKEKIKSNLEFLDDMMIELDKNFSLGKNPKYKTHYNSTWTRQVAIEVSEIIIYGVYAPILGICSCYHDRCKYFSIVKPGNYIKCSRTKSEFWDYCIKPVQEELKNRKSIIIGDFNEFRTIDHEEGISSALCCNLCELEGKEWVDAWKEKNKSVEPPDKARFTYYKKTAKNEDGIGRRLDYAFLSKSLSKHLVAAEHLHDVRQDGLSDHSALLIELDLGEENNQAAQQP